MAVYLISGGSGHIGRALARRLNGLGHEVRVLGRTRRGTPGVKEYVWAPEHGRVEVEAFLGVDCVINLAGAGIADKKWSPEYKKILVDSRVKVTRMVGRVIVTGKQLYRDWETDLIVTGKQIGGAHV